MVKNVTLFLSVLVIGVSFISKVEAGKKEVEALKDWSVKEKKTPPKKRNLYYSGKTMKLTANAKRTGVKAQVNLMQRINQLPEISAQNNEDNQ